MSWELSDAEISSAAGMSMEDRYEYFVDKVIGHGKIWSLKNEEGWVLGDTNDGGEAIPVWPHSDYAKACATGAWENNEPASIDLPEFLEKFVPKMIEDKRLLAVFEVGESPAIVIQPDLVASDLDISVDE